MRSDRYEHDPCPGDRSRHHVPRRWQHGDHLEALLAGQSGVDVMKHDWAEQLSTQIAAEVAVEPGDVLDRVKARRLDRSGQFAMVAALEAWADAGFGEGGAEVDPERLGVAMASGIGGVTTLLNNYDQLLQKGPRRVSPCRSRC